MPTVPAWRPATPPPRTSGSATWPRSATRPPATTATSTASRCPRSTSRPRSTRPASTSSPPTRTPVRCRSGRSWWRRTPTSPRCARPPTRTVDPPARRRCHRQRATRSSTGPATRPAAPATPCREAGAGVATQRDRWTTAAGQLVDRRAVRAPSSGRARWPTSSGSSGRHPGRAGRGRRPGGGGELRRGDPRTRGSAARRGADRAGSSAGSTGSASSSSSRRVDRRLPRGGPRAVTRCWTPPPPSPTHRRRRAARHLRRAGPAAGRSRPARRHLPGELGELARPTSTASTLSWTRPGRAGRLGRRAAPRHRPASTA